MRRGTKGFVALASAAALIMLGGCVPGLPSSGDADALAEEIRGLTGGECFGAINGMLAFSERVPCDELHRFEVVRTVDLPSELAGTSYTDALDLAGDANRRIREFVLPLCAAELAEATGLDAVTRLAPALDGAALWPAIPGAITAHLPPEVVWDENPLVVCAVSWFNSTGAPVDVESRTEAPMVGTYGSPGADDTMRTCLIMQKGGYVQAPCAQAHYAEALFQFDAAMALGDAWVTAADVAAFTEEEWSDLDGLCGAAAPVVFDAERTAGDVAILAEVFLQAWGVPLESGGSYPVMCLVLPTDPAMLLDGPVWGLGDEPATLVPAT